MKYIYKDENSDIELTILDEGEETVKTKLTIKSNINGLESYDNTFEAVNIDTEGLASLEELDPSGEFNPVQIFDCEQNGKIFSVIIPYEELEEGNYVGLNVREKSNPEKVLLEVVLR